MICSSVFLLSVFLLSAYLIIASNYTLASLLDTLQYSKYWYLLPIALCGSLLLGWFYFPCDVGFKLYKKLNDTNDTKN